MTFKGHKSSVSIVQIAIVCFMMAVEKAQIRFNVDQMTTAGGLLKVVGRKMATAPNIIIPRNEESHKVSLECDSSFLGMTNITGNYSGKVLKFH